MSPGVLEASESVHPIAAPLDALRLRAEGNALEGVHNFRLMRAQAMAAEVQQYP